METGVFNVTIRNVLAISANKKIKAVQLHAQQAYGGGPDIALTIHYPGARRGWVVSATPRLLYSWQRDAATIVQEAGWASWPICMGLENLPKTRVGTPGCPPSGKSLC
jgi:hypothetical protein